MIFLSSLVVSVALEYFMGFRQDFITTPWMTLLSAGFLVLTLTFLIDNLAGYKSRRTQRAPGAR